MCPQSRKLQFDSNNLPCLSQFGPMHLGQACCSDRLRFKFTKNIFYLAFKVVFINYLDLFKWYLGTLILEHLEHLNVLLRCYSLQGAYVLASLEIDTTTRLTQVKKSLCNSPIHLEQFLIGMPTFSLIYMYSSEG